MNIRAVKTVRITTGQTSLIEALERALDMLREGDVLAVSSKIVALCEGRARPASQNKKSLIREEAEWYLPGQPPLSLWFTITQRTLIPTAGIDESNGGGDYVLWPRDAQASANRLRAYLADRFRLRKVGVIITDSTSQPLRRGTTGIALAHSGFKALKDYRGQPDLFGKPLGSSQASLAGGLAAAAVLAMGEGAEQTPLCVISDLPFIEFQNRDPSPEELSELYPDMEEDIFAPFLRSVKWQRGGRGAYDA